jgi:hypothetical protein
VRGQRPSIETEPTGLRPNVDPVVAGRTAFVDEKGMCVVARRAPFRPRTSPSPSYRLRGLYVPRLGMPGRTANGQRLKPRLQASGQTSAYADEEVLSS